MIKIKKYYYPLLFLYFFLIFLGALPSLKLPGGIRVFIVKTGSMKPTLSPGDIVITKPEVDYRPQEIVTFLNPNQGTNEYPTLTHHIQTITEKNGATAYITKGDANPLPDKEIITLNNIIGRVFLSIPLLGYATDFLKSKIGFIIFIMTPGIFIIFQEIMHIKRYIRK